MKKLLCFLLTISLLLGIAFCAISCGSEKDDALSTIETWQQTYTVGAFGIRSKSDPFVEFTLSTGESIRVELYPSVAPRSVENFITYVKEGFYEGVAFHRILEGQMIQCGGFELQDDLYVHKDATHPPHQRGI